MANQLFTKVQQTAGGSPGSLADIYIPPGGYGYVNVVKDYPWTVSEQAKTTIGRVILREFQVLESTIKRQALFYINGLETFAGQGDQAYTGQGNRDFLAAYKQLFPKDKPTGFVYDMPYFSEINFEVNSPEWQALDTLEQIAKTGPDVATGLASLFKDVPGLGSAVTGITEAATKFYNVAGAGAMAGISTVYPKVGIMDRPRLWETHYPRSIIVTFPLYNTLAPDDWKKNRLLCELLVNQNLYNKRDFITSVPPVFYEVLVLGQHYSYASCVTNITVYNRGNVRILKNDEGFICNVPDVYEISITLTDMVIPSKNQFQSIQNEEVVASITGRNGQTFFQGAEQTLSDFEQQLLNGIQQVAGSTAGSLQQNLPYKP